MSQDPELVLNTLELMSSRSTRLEINLDRLQDDGIELGREAKESDKDVVDMELFQYDIVKRAKTMANFYVVYYAFENYLRQLISDRLTEKYGKDWWATKVPKEVIDYVAKIKSKELDGILNIRSLSNLDYTTFGQLIEIFNYNWADFSDTIRSQKAMVDVLSRFSQVRNIIAHSCDLSDDDIYRTELLVKDWFRIQT